MSLKVFANFIIILVCCCFINQGYAQTDKQQQLEKKRKELQREISRINTLRKNNQKKERSVLDELDELTSQISTRQNLVRVTNRQMNILSRQINSNIKRIGELREELKALKKDYAQMIVKSYKSKSQQSRIMFLLSSESFLQAYKRLQYMKQYTQFQKEQGQMIEDRTQSLQQLNTDLVDQKKQKQQLIEENRLAQNQLDKEKEQQNSLISSIRQKQGVYAAQIKKKQKEANKIDKQIESLIREAIAKANKKAAKAGTKTSTTKFELTPEARAIATNFTANKGKLPWPVIRGKVIKKFGKQPHPTLPNITIDNSGVEIETAPGEKAQAIFGGEVSTVQSIRGAGKLVQIRHGNYITTYYNLHNIKVTEGQKVSAKDAIGQVRTNPSSGRAIIKFLIYQNAKRLNPQQWIYKM